MGTAAAVAASALVLSVGVAGAATHVEASSSAFCKTILSFHAKEPTGTSYSSYQKWAKAYLPFWQKLASEAPSGATKTVLNELVTVVKYEASAKNYKALGAYYLAHQKQWTAGWKAFAKDIVSCATSLY